MIPFPNIPGKALAIGGAVAAAALVLTLAYCQGRTAGRQSEIVGQQERTIEAERTVGAANDTAADQRVADAITLEQQQQELEDARNCNEDPDTVRKRRACVVMRQQGRDTSAFPACRRFEGGAGACGAGGDAGGGS